jgi:hypothetical protein
MTSCTLNADCDKSYESCAQFYWTKVDGGMTKAKKCIPTKYCNMNDDNKDKLTTTTLALSGRVMCQSKKVDASAPKKPAVVIPATLKRLNPGHRCKTVTKFVPEYDKLAYVGHEADYTTTQQAA